MDVLAIARKPPVVVAPNDSIMYAVNTMDHFRVGAVAVVENEAVVGIFTERDLLERVVKNKISSLDTQISEVMTRDPYTITPDQMEPREAFEFMTEKHLRHLPVVDGAGRIQGMLSVRHLMKMIVKLLHDELGFLNAFIAAG